VVTGYFAAHAPLTCALWLWIIVRYTNTLTYLLRPYTCSESDPLFCVRVSIPDSGPVHSTNVL